MMWWRRALVASAAILSCAVAAQPSEDVSSENRAVSEIFRATPRDVLDLREAMQRRQASMYQPIEEVVEPRDELVTLGLAPDEPSPTLYLNYLSPSVLQIFDATGEPWPILDVAIVHEELVDGHIVEGEYNNSVILFNKRPQGAAYITVFLKNSPLPLSVRVVASPEKYHRNLRVKVEDLGPNARLDADVTAAVRSMGLGPDEDLQSALAGVTPYDAASLKSSRPDVMAWRKNGEILLRTRLSVFAPEILRVETGQGGFRAYRLRDSTRVLASDTTGGVVQIQLTEAGL